VEKYCYFLKSVADARNIRQRIIECFERASSPTTTKAERSRLLHFVIVGGGPTSVEFSAELHGSRTHTLRGIATYGRS